MPARRKTTATPPTRTTDEARTWLRANGITIAAFARKHGLSRDVVGDGYLAEQLGISRHTPRSSAAGPETEPGFCHTIPEILAELGGHVSRPSTTQSGLHL